VYYYYYTKNRQNRIRIQDPQGKLEKLPKNISIKSKILVNHQSKILVSPQSKILINPQPNLLVIPSSKIHAGTEYGILVSIYIYIIQHTCVLSIQKPWTHNPKYMRAHNWNCLWEHNAKYMIANNWKSICAHNPKHLLSPQYKCTWSCNSNTCEHSIKYTFELTIQNVQNIYIITSSDKVHVSSDRFSFIFWLSIVFHDNRI
jgi:hypothetical protein